MTSSVLLDQKYNLGDLLFKTVLADSPFLFKMMKFVLHVFIV